VEAGDDGSGVTVALLVGDLAGVCRADWDEAGQVELAALPDQIRVVPLARRDRVGGRVIDPWPGGLGQVRRGDCRDHHPAIRWPALVAQLNQAGTRRRPCWAGTGRSRQEQVIGQMRIVVEDDVVVAI
jgi:hypothetical protein